MVNIKQIIWTDDALDALEKIPEKMSNRIYDKVEAMATGDTRNVKKLANCPYYRLRVGNYRVLFDDDGSILEILEVATRGAFEKIYKKITK